MNARTTLSSVGQAARRLRAWRIPGRWFPGRRLCARRLGVRVAILDHRAATVADARSLESASAPAQERVGEDPTSR